MLKYSLVFPSSIVIFPFVKIYPRIKFSFTLAYKLEYRSHTRGTASSGWKYVQPRNVRMRELLETDKGREISETLTKSIKSEVPNYFAYIFRLFIEIQLTNAKFAQEKQPRFC